MPKRGDKEFLLDIIESIKKIDSYLLGLDFTLFLNDFKTQDAVVRNLEIIGEASKRLTLALQSNFGEIPWKQMSSLRNRLIHDYSGINLDIVWGIVKQELPPLLSKLEDILNNI